MKGFLQLAFIFVFFSIPALRADDSPTITQEELIRRTQLLMDAYAPGNPAPFRLYVADDVLFFDDHAMDKKALLESVKPLPSGYSGMIRVENAKARIGSGVAILAYDTSETETIFGRTLHARYHITDTWLYRNRSWQIAASETLRYYEDPAAAFIPPDLLTQYVGSYQLAPGHIIKITRQGGHLYAQRVPGKSAELLAESVDLFFRAGVEGRYLFHHDASGHVDMLIDRRNNEDLLWKRVE